MVNPYEISSRLSQNIKLVQQAPILDAVIPDILRGENAWRIAVKQWDEFLRDWPRYKYTGSMRLVNGAKRSQRKTIALEYDAYGRDDERFLRDYPSGRKSIMNLVVAIRKKNGRRRRSRNGTPEERELLAHPGTQ